MADIMDRISHMFGGFTNSQKTIASYMMDNMNSISFDTLEELSGKIGVSTTTVIRFARALGYDGFSEMQKDLQADLRDKVSLPERLSESSAKKVRQDELLRSSFKNDLNNIQKTLEGINDRDMSSALELIEKADNVYVLGLRSSYALAHYMTTRLGQIRKNVHLITSVGMTYPEEIVSSSPNDACIAYLFPRYSKISANIIMWMRRRGTKIVLFTNSNYSAVKDYGDIILPCSIHGISFKNSFAAPICLINYIAAAIAARNYDESRTVLEETEEILTHGYYLGL